MEQSFSERVRDVDAYKRFVATHRAALLDRRDPGHEAAVEMQSRLARIAFPEATARRTALAGAAGDALDHPTADRQFDFVHAPTAEHEGGIDPNTAGTDPGGPTNRGLSTKLWRTIRHTAHGVALYPEVRDWPGDVLDLSREQVRHVLRKEFYDRLGVDRLARVPGLLDRAPQLVRQIYDINVQHGAMHAGRWLQQALNVAVGANLEVDGLIGRKTRAAVADAVAQNKLEAVNDMIAADRLSYMKTLGGWSDRAKGWSARAESYLSTNRAR
jgi:lysozyme family protein